MGAIMLVVGTKWSVCAAEFNRNGGTWRTTLGLFGEEYLKSRNEKEEAFEYFVYVQ